MKFRLVCSFARDSLMLKSSLNWIGKESNEGGEQLSGEEMNL
jgi:hypothetical protein